MWFDELMDDCKEALKVVSENKSVFIPILVRAGIVLLFLIMAVIGVVFFTAFSMNGIERAFRNGEMPSLATVAFVLLCISFVYLFFTILGAIMEVGSVSMFKAAADGIKPRAVHFFDGVKKYFFRVFGTTVLVNIIVLILSLPIIALLLLYAVTIGVLTAGWGVLFLSALLTVYFGAWIIAVVEDDKGAFDAIRASMRLGKRYYWGLLILALSAAVIGKYIAAAFGGVVALFGGWFLLGVVTVYFKVVILLIYRRRKEELI